MRTYVAVPIAAAVPVAAADHSMTRPYTASERNNTELYKPQWTDRYGDYVFAASPRWPSERAVASNISIGEHQQPHGPFGGKGGRGNTDGGLRPHMLAVCGQVVASSSTNIVFAVCPAVPIVRLLLGLAMGNVLLPVPCNINA